MSEEDELIGNEAAAEYVGVKPSTWRAWTSDKRRETSGVPEPHRRETRGGHAIPVWRKAQLDRWQESRRGLGWRRGLRDTEDADG